MDLDFVSVHKNAKKELGQYPAILTSRLVNNAYFLKSNFRLDKSAIYSQIALFFALNRILFLAHQNESEIITKKIILTKNCSNSEQIALHSVQLPLYTTYSYTIDFFYFTSYLLNLLGLCSKVYVYYELATICVV